jgi:hypothetical protein
MAATCAFPVASSALAQLLSHLGALWSWSRKWNNEYVSHERLTIHQYKASLVFSP